MGTFTLTDLQYSQDRKGPWKVYVYKKDSNEYEFVRWCAKVPQDDELHYLDAYQLVLHAEKEGREIRVCDGGDMLVYHSKGIKVLYGNTFWNDLIKSYLAREEDKS